MSNSEHTAPQHSLPAIYRMMIEAAGEQGNALRNSLLLLVLGAIAQGLAFACFLPLFAAIGHGDSAALWPWLGVLSGLIVIATTARWIAQGFDYSGHSARAGHELRTRLGRQLRRIPLQTLYRQRSGELNATLAGNVDEVMNYTMTISAMLVNAVVVPLTVGLLAFFYDWRMAVALLLVFPMIVPIYRWARPLLIRGKDEQARANAMLSAEIVEYTQGLPVLKAANHVGPQADRLQRALAIARAAQVGALRAEALPNVVLATAMELGLLLILLLGMLWVLGGSLSIMILAALMVAVIRFAEPLSIFLSMMSVYEMIVTGYGRLRDLQAVQPLEQLTPETQPTQFDIAFESLSFTYAGTTEPAVSNVDLTIPERAMTALVGPSGCGKTTLTRMIMRYADPDQGVLRIGGVDIRQIPPERLMRLISVVFQDVYLFDDSIIENIRLGRADADDEAVYAAARQAQCHDFIQRLPDGYQTRVGDIGGSLSGGERQRISIARALLKDAPIVILDEPTAALDTESEVAVQRAIDALVRDKTVIVIAHRLSTIVGARNIVVLDAGKIVEQGTHEALLEADGRYTRLWQAQQSVKHWTAAA